MLKWICISFYIQITGGALEDLWVSLIEVNWASEVIFVSNEVYLVNITSEGKSIVFWLILKWKILQSFSWEPICKSVRLQACSWWCSILSTNWTAKGSSIAVINIHETICFLKFLIFQNF